MSPRWFPPLLWGGFSNSKNHCKILPNCSSKFSTFSPEGCLGLPHSFSGKRGKRSPCLCPAGRWFQAGSLPPCYQTSTCRRKPRGLPLPRALSPPRNQEQTCWQLGGFSAFSGFKSSYRKITSPLPHASHPASPNSLHYPGSAESLFLLDFATFWQDWASSAHCTMQCW